MTDERNEMQVWRWVGEKMRREVNAGQERVAGCVTTGVLAIKQVNGAYKRG